MDRFPVYVAVDQLSLGWCVVIQMVFPLLSTIAPRRINVFHILDRVGREERKGYMPSVKNQTKGHA
jgi:hypothetical protein